MNVLIVIVCVLAILTFIYIAVLHTREVKRLRKWRETQKAEARKAPYSFSGDLVEIAGYDDLRIRIMPDDNDKRITAFVTSLPHHLTSDEVLILNSELPQVYGLSKMDDFVIAVKVSPAADYLKVEKIILDYLSEKLRRVYKWECEVQKVKIEISTSDCLVLYLPELEFCNHKNFWHNLRGIKGVSRVETEGDHFEINRYPYGKWSEIRPLIEQQLNNYFTGGCEIIGEWPDDERCPTWGEKPDSGVMHVSV